ncbi:MAG: extracellular solute-binding protein [Bacillota bacterium]|nr:extracellular solute-binding protein [Bacillota bacterium]
MKKNFFVKCASIGLAAITVSTSLVACNRKQSAGDIEGYGAWKGGVVYKVDDKKINGYTFRVSAYRDFSSDPLNHEYADGAEKFMKDHPGTNVKYLTVGDHAPQSIAAAIAAGDVWDLQYVFTCSQMPGDIVDGIYEPIDGYFNLNDKRINKKSIMGGYFDGHYYGVSNEVMNEMMYVSYNENVFKENGIKTPHEYYKEGKWNFDAFFDICKQLKEKGLKINTGKMVRPDWILKKATKWNADYTKADVILDSNDTRQYLDKLKTIAYDYKLENEKGGSVAKREVALSCDVVPNVLITNSGSETADTIRYIYFPSTLKEEIGPHIYVTDAQFMTPTGSNQKMKAGAVELGICMGMGRKDYLMDYYKKSMSPDDYNLLMESMKNEKPLPRGFSPDFMYYNFAFYAHMMTGEPVATYISEIKTKLDTCAKSFNQKIEEYRQDTGLSDEKK